MKRRLRRAAAVLALLACAAAGALLLLDADALRGSVEREVSAIAGGEVRAESLAVRLLPWPHAALRGVSVKIPGVAEGNIVAVEIRFALLPLLAGKFRPTDVHASGPALRIGLAPAAGGDPLSNYRRVVGPLVAALTHGAAGMTLAVSDGQIEFRSAGRSVLSLSGLSASLTASTDDVRVSASSAADLWQKAQGRARIAAGSLAASASLKLAGLHLEQVMELGSAGGEFTLRPAPIDGDFDIETDGRGEFRLRSSVAAAQLVLERGARRRELGAVRAAWEVVRDGRTLTAKLKDLQLGGLVRGAAGEIRVPLAGAGADFAFKLAQADLAQLHAAAATLAGEGVAAPAPFSYVPAGNLRELSLSGSWPAGSASIPLASIRAATQVDEATVAVPAAGIVVRGGSGRFLLADGVLQGSGFAGGIGNSSISAGSLTLELRPAIRLRRLHAILSADLADALAIARQLTVRRPLAAVAAIEALDGRASGTIDYDAVRSASPLTLDLSGIRAIAKLQGLQFPVVASGAAEIGARRLNLKNLAVMAGDTRATVSGSIEDYTDTGRRADLQFSQGALGPRGLEWLRARWQVPEGAMPRMPIDIAAARLHWPGALPEPVLVQGKVRFAGELDAEFDV
ncbi:MAG TPA: hypothetical protein VMJ14_11405, partial [Burkholderiales bacterium]|nr:hypothetical protein [Burkholderiales bacterium]